MTTFLTVLHILVCLFLIAVILLQRGRGAEIGAVFGAGASATVFGGRGAGNFLTKLTSASAAIFMITSLSLAYLSRMGGERMFEDQPEAPAGAAAAPAAPAAGGGFEEVGKATAPAAAPPAEAAPALPGREPAAPAPELPTP